MKKIVFIAMLCNLLFVACKKENETTTHQVPARKIENGRLTIFQYDNQNRLIREIFVWGAEDRDTIEYVYNPDGTPKKILRLGKLDGDVEFIYSGNHTILKISSRWNWAQDLMAYDTAKFMLNPNGEIVNMEAWGVLASFTYNSNGNITAVDYGSERADMLYSDVPSIWRHVNVPNWFFAVVWGDFWVSKTGYMLRKKTKSWDCVDSDNEVVEYIYEGNDYVSRVTRRTASFGNTKTEIMLFEYVLAK